MNRFRQKRSSSHMLRRIITTAALFGLLCAALLLGVSEVQKSAGDSQRESLRLAILRSAVHCYAMQGVYPESLDYIREHYGIEWNPERYIVDYEVTGSNLMPDVTVFPIHETAVFHNREGAR